jgi:hypothetical protein
MAKIIITEKQLIDLRKSIVNEDATGLKPGEHRICKGGYSESCLMETGNLKYNVKGDKPYFALIYKVASGDTMSGILSKLNKKGNFIIKNPMELNTLLKNENDLKPNDVLLFNFEV